MNVYIVQLDWSTTDCEDTDLFVYDTYDKAYNKFKELIAEEKSINSWVRGLCSWRVSDAWTRRPTPWLEP